MSSLLPDFEYDIFISYRHNDNRTGWVSEFVHSLQEELAVTIKQPLSIYFDKNVHDGLLETHNVDKSLEGKLKCLIFIPIISQTYCDTKSFAWQHELCAFNKLAKEDAYGLYIQLGSGNVANRILPIKIHELDTDDKELLEKELGTTLRALEFIFKSPGVNRPLRVIEDHPHDNLNKTYYRDQVNKVANTIKEIVQSINHLQSNGSHRKTLHSTQNVSPGPDTRKRIMWTSAMLLLILFTGFVYYNWFYSGIPSEQKSIAVMPFKLIGNDQEGKYFAEGVADALINHLHGIKNLKVRSRTSVEKYAGSQQTIPEIGKELGVQYILEGSTQKYKDDVRIIVQLINTSTDEHVWFKEYNEKFDDIFRIQSEIALNITSELNIRLVGSQIEKVQKAPTENAEAWDLYLRGKEYQRNYWKHWKDADGRIAMEFFRRAIEKDPKFALGYATLAGSSGAFISQDSVLMLINTAIELDPDLPDVYEHLGLLYLYHSKEYDKAIETIQRAVQLDSLQNFLLSLGRAYSRKQDHFNALISYSAAFSKEKTEFYQWLLLETGTSYMAVGDFSLAQSFTAGALRYEPDNQSFLGQMAYIQMLKGDFDGMFQTANRLVSIQNSAFGRTILARYYLIKGDFEKSIAVYRDCFSQANNNDYFWTDEKVSFAYALNKVGKVREAAELLQQANKALESNIDNRAYVQAKVYALQGDNIRAVDALKKWKAIPGFHLWLVNDPLFSALKQNADFKEFVDKLHADAEVVKKQSDEKRAAGLFPTLDMIEKN